MQYEAKSRLQCHLKKIKLLYLYEPIITTVGAEFNIMSLKVIRKKTPCWETRTHLYNSQ